MYYKCLHCGYEFQGPLKYCPNCHQENRYQSGIKALNNWQAAWGKEPTLGNAFDDLGKSGCSCGCSLIILFILAAIVMGMLNQ